MARYKKPIDHRSMPGGSDHDAWMNPKKYCDPACKTCDGKGLVWVNTGTRNECDMAEPLLCGCMRKKLPQESR